MAKDKRVILESGVPTIQTTSDNIEDFTNDASAVAVGDAVYISAAGKVSKAANTSAAQECVGIVFEIVDTTNCRVLTQGRIIDWSTGMTPGDRYYLGATAGQLTTTKPVGANVQQVVAIAFSATDLYICPLLGMADTIADGGAASSSLDDAYTTGRAIDIDLGSVTWTHNTAAQAGAAHVVDYSAVAFTGTPHGFSVDMSGATSITNAGSIYGISLAGKTNAGAGVSVGLAIDTGFDVGLHIEDDTALVFGNTPSAPDAGLSWDTRLGTDGLHLTTGAADIRGRTVLSSFVQVREGDAGFLEIGGSLPTEGLAVQVEDGGGGLDDLAAIEARIDNTNGTARGGNTFSAFYAHVEGKDVTETAGAYTAFKAFTAIKNSSTSTFTGLHIGSVYDVGIQVDGGTLDFNGSDVDLDPTGDFTLDMASTKTCVLTISPNLGTDAFTIKDGTYTYIDMDTNVTGVIPHTDFGVRTIHLDGIKAQFGSADTDAGIYWDTALTPDGLHIYSGSIAGSRTLTLVSSYVQVRDGESGFLELGGTEPYDQALTVQGESAHVSDDIDAFRGTIDNTAGTARSGGVASAVAAWVEGRSTDSAGDYSAFRAYAAVPNGGSSTYTGLYVAENYTFCIDSYSGDLRMQGGDLDFNGVNIDLDPTGTFNLAMDASQTITITIANNVTDSFLVKDGSYPYIDVTTTTSSEAMNFGNTNYNPDFNFLGSGILTLPSSVFLADDATVALGNVAVTPDATLEWDTSLATDALHVQSGSSGSRTGVNISGHVIVADADNMLGVGTAPDYWALNVKAESNAVNSSGAILGTYDNTAGTARSANTGIGVGAWVEGRATDSGGSYAAFYAYPAVDNGGSSTFIGLFIGTGFDVGLDVDSGSIDLDPTGNFTLDMDAAKTAIITIADSLATDAFTIKDGGGQSYIDIDTNAERTQFLASTWMGDDVSLTFGNVVGTPDAFIEWDTLSTPYDALHLFAGSYPNNPSYIYLTGHVSIGNKAVGGAPSDLKLDATYTHGLVVETYANSGTAEIQGIHSDANNASGSHRSTSVYAAFAASLAGDSGDTGGDYVGYWAKDASDGGGASTFVGARIGGSYDVGIEIQSGGLLMTEMTKPTGVADKGWLYTKDSGGTTELFYTDSADSETQLTGTTPTVTLDDAYTAGRAINIDLDSAVWTHNTAAQVGAAHEITYDAVAFTGQPHGLSIELNGATSFSNASSIYGIWLGGATNAGAGDSKGIYVDGGWDYGIQLANDTYLVFGAEEENDAGFYWDNTNTQLVLTTGFALGQWREFVTKCHQKFWVDSTTPMQFGASGSQLDVAVEVLVESASSTAGGTCFYSFIDNNAGTAISSASFTGYGVQVRGNASDSGGTYTCFSGFSYGTGSASYVGLDLGSGFDYGVNVASGGVWSSAGFSLAGASEAAPTYKITGQSGSPAHLYVETGSADDRAPIVLNGYLRVAEDEYGFLQLGGTQDEDHGIEVRVESAHASDEIDGAYVWMTNTVGTTRTGGVVSGFRAEMTAKSADDAAADYIAFKAEGSDSGGSATLTGLQVGSDFEIGVELESGGILMTEQSAPTGVANKGWLYTKDVSGTTELCYKDSSDSETQITGVSASVSFDDAYNGGQTATVDNGQIQFTQSTAAETQPVLLIDYAASAFTGTPHGLSVDMSGATSVTNAGDVYGLELVGKTNAGAGDTVGVSLDANWDQGIENASSLVQSGAAAFSGTLSFTGTNIDLDPTGTFALDMNASQTCIITIADTLSTNAFVVKDGGGQSYIDIDTGSGLEKIRFAANTRYEDGVEARFGSSDDAVIYWNTSATPDCLNMRGGAVGSRENFIINMHTFIRDGTSISQHLELSSSSPTGLSVNAEASDASANLDAINVQFDNTNGDLARSGGTATGVRSHVEGKSTDSGGTYIAFYADDAVDNGGSGSFVGLTVGASFDMGIDVQSGGIQLAEQSVPSTPTNAGIVYVKDDSSDSELFYLDDSGNEVQLTADGTVYREYQSATRTTASSTQTGLFNVMATNNGGAASSNASKGGISFTAATGLFTVTDAGDYEINAVVYLEHSTTTALDSFIIRKGGSTTVWTGTTNVHSSVDPVERSISVILTLAASDYLEVMADSNSTSTLTAHPGCTVNVKRVG